MDDDKVISQLISKSLRRKLSDEEQNSVEQHLSNNEESRKFAEISKVIQDSIVLSAEKSMEESPRLSDDAKNRLRNSLAVAISESQAKARSDDSQEQRIQKQVIDELSAENDGRELASRFKLIRLLSRGGLGNIWLARDKKLNRVVAIKELHRESLESPQAWERLRREAEITGHLEHPNVIPIYQYGEDRKTGEPFYAMRFVGKRTLTDAIIEHHDRMNAGEVCNMATHRLLSVFLDICQAIAYAHSRGVVHRDLKPDNVALDNFGQVIVLDWGLAKVLEDGELANKMTNFPNLQESTLRQTMQGDVVGTPLYMAPEQAAGDLDNVDDKTDVYGLGAILFSILCGKAPHEKSVDGNVDSLNQVLKTIAESNTPRPGEFCQHVPRELEDICGKAMARKRHLRYKSVTELSEAVELWMAGQSGKQAGYDNLRMEGRELRADLESSVRDLERNVRFMSTLPPIQELIHSSEADVMVWRERLAKIFHGLLRANPDYRNVLYSRVVDGQYTEIVRVERHSTDASSIRIVPRSRLRTDPCSEHVLALLQHQPDEVRTSLVCDPLCKLEVTCAQDVGLSVGVPVYDDETEEVFGFVMINCDIDQLLQRQMSRRTSAAEMVVACDVFHVMVHSENGQLVEQSISQPVQEVVPHFQHAVDVLQNESEYIDEANSDIYGARVWFISNQHGVMYLLRRKTD